MEEKKKFGSQPTNSDNTCDKEHIRLTEIITKWNQERFSLFEISLPDRNLEFFGVIRFFYRDPKGPINSKCIKVSSIDRCLEVTEVLVEKFHSDMKMLSNPEDFFLWEIFPNAERRLLTRDEIPLLVQLNWNKDERDGYFLLEQSLSDSRSNLDQSDGLRTGEDRIKKKWKRKLTLKFTKSFSRSSRTNESKGDSKPSTSTPPLTRNLSTHSSLYPPIPQSCNKSEVYSQLQGMHLMRTLSNPEVVLKRRRERKMDQIRETLKNPGTTALKIYAENLLPEVPYKTLLVTPENSVHDVIRSTLEKYHMEREDPSDFCLVQYSLPNAASCVTTTGKDECILEPGDHPLCRYREHRVNFPTLQVIFQLRRIDQAIRPKIIPQELRPLPPFESFRARFNKGRQSLPCLFPMQGGKSEKQHRIQLYLHDFRILVGSRRGSNLQADRFIALEGEDILPEHCVLEGYKGLCRLVPSSHEAAVFVDNKLVCQCTILTTTCIIRFGEHFNFQFCCSDSDPVHASLQSQGPHIGSGRGMESETEGRPSSSLGDYRREVRGIQRVLSDGAINEFSRLQMLNLHEDTPETFFMSDGKVISLSNYSSSNMDDFIPEELPRPLLASARTLRGSRMKEEPLILPAMLSFPEHSASLLLDCFTTDLNYSQLSFKQAPAYALYICARSFLGGDCQYASSLSQRLQSMREVLACVCSLLKATVAQNRHIPGPLVFWINNIVELLNFLKLDDELCPHCPDALSSLSQISCYAFKCLNESLWREIDPHLDSLFSPAKEHPQPSDCYLDMLWKPGGIVTRVPHQIGSSVTLFAVLEAISSLAASCHLNKEITRELYTRLLHFIDANILNKLLLTRSYTAPASLSALRPRVKIVQAWGKEQGVGGSLSFCSQAISLLIAGVATSHTDIRAAVAKSHKLSSLQIRTLLEMVVMEGTRDILQELADESPNSPSPLLLSTKVPRPLKIPDSGYSCETVLGLPVGLKEFVEPAVQKGLCQLHEVSLLSTGNWVKCSDLAARRLSESRSSVESSSIPPMLPTEPSTESLPVPFSRGGSYPSCQEPSRYLELELVKGDSDSIGISVVSCRLKSQFKSVILIKSVLDNPALADGRLERGDQIVKVDDINLEEPGMTQERATCILRATGKRVRLKILKKESVSFMLSTTNLYYSDTELSDSDSLSLAKSYSYRPGHRAALLNKHRFSASPWNKQPIATHYEEESNPRSYYTQCPSFSRGSRHSGYSHPLHLPERQTPPEQPSKFQFSADTYHKPLPTRYLTPPHFEPLFAPPLDPYQPPSYTLQFVPNLQHQYGAFRHYHPQYSSPIHLESGHDSSDPHKVSDELYTPTSIHSPPVIATATATANDSQSSKGELLSRLSQDEVELASSISQREKKLQEVRANIELLREQEPMSLGLSHTHYPVSDVGRREREHYIPLSHTASQLSGFHPSHMQRYFHPSTHPLILPSPHSLPNNIPASSAGPSTPHLLHPPDVIQSTLPANRGQNTDTLTFNAAPQPRLPLSETILAQPMSLQDKMDFFIHKSNS